MCALGTDTLKHNNLYPRQKTLPTFSFLPCWYFSAVTFPVGGGGGACFERGFRQNLTTQLLPLVIVLW